MFIVDKLQYGKKFFAVLCILTVYHKRSGPFKRFHSQLVISAVYLTGGQLYFCKNYIIDTGMLREYNNGTTEAIIEARGA